jgi:hypothetical protein
MTDIRQLVQELLAQLGSSREAQQYLKEYSGTNQARFAVVKVGGVPSVHDAAPYQNTGSFSASTQRDGPFRGAIARSVND